MPRASAELLALRPLNANGTAWTRLNSHAAGTHARMKGLPFLSSLTSLCSCRSWAASPAAERMHVDDTSPEGSLFSRHTRWAAIGGAAAAQRVGSVGISPADTGNTGDAGMRIEAVQALERSAPREGKAALTTSLLFDVDGDQVRPHAARSASHLRRGRTLGLPRVQPSLRGCLGSPPFSPGARDLPHPPHLSSCCSRVLAPVVLQEPVVYSPSYDIKFMGLEKL